MSFKQSNTSQGSDEFQGLKDTNSEADFGVDSDDRRDRKKETKKFLFKKDSKEKGYSSLAGDLNQDSVFLVNKKAKSDAKKTSLNVFKKSFKDEKRLKDIKEGKEESKRSKKTKSSDKQKENLFGNYLENVVSSFSANDGVRVPYPIRICIDVIEQRGIESEHIYRHHSNKSQLESICESINNESMETRLDELNADPTLACAIIKKFLKELKSPLIQDDLLPSFDKCDSIDKEQKVSQFKKLFENLPQSNYETMAYLIMHFHRVLKRSDVNRIELSLFVQKFQPFFKIKERCFKFLILNADSIFSEFRFKRYRVKTIDETIGRFSLLPESIEDLEQEISKQEIYLSKLHTKIANQEGDQDKISEELWALQRYVTSLKRKLKKLKSEKKLIETEQIKSINEAVSKHSNKIKNGGSNGKDNSQEQQEKEISTVNPQEETTFDEVEILNKETKIICENFVLVESIRQLLEKIANEKVSINELQNTIASSNAVYPVPDANIMTIQELHDKEQIIMNENKLLEERINLINKRIIAEKDKIFELKLNIKLKTIEISNLEQQQLACLTQNNINNNLKLGLAEDRELFMTKL